MFNLIKIILLSKSALKRNNLFPGGKIAVVSPTGLSPLKIILKSKIALKRNNGG